MKKPSVLLVVMGLVTLAPMIALADDLTGTDRILCTSVQVTICQAGGECEIGPPWEWNIPQFVEIDLKAKTLGTTKASPDYS